MKARFFLLACAANAALAGTAAAQANDATRGLGSLTADDPLEADDRYVTVRERRHPEWEAEPIRLDSLELMPQIAASGGYDDNLFATRTQRIGDAFLTARPRLTVTRPSPNLRLVLDATADLTRYARRTSENVTDYAVEGRAGYRISQATRFDLALTHARAAEERISPDSPTGVIRPNRFTVSQAAATISHGINRLRLRGGIDVERRDYRDGETPAGLEVDQDFRDRTTITAMGAAEYALSPSVALFGAAAFNRRDYRERQGPVPARDSQGYELALGTTFDIGRRMRGSVRAGYLKQDYRDPFFRDIDGLLVRGEVAWLATPLLTVTAAIDRSVTETGILDAAGYLKTVTSLRADYELLRNLILSAEVEREQRDYVDLTREDDRWTWRGSASYRLSRRVALNAGFQHRDQSSTGISTGREFEKTRFSLGVTLTGM